MKERLQNIIRAALSRQGAIFLLWIVFAGLSLGSMGSMVSRFREREENYIRLWAQSMSRMADAEWDTIIREIVDERNSIPFIIMNERQSVERSNLVDEKVLRDPVLLQRKISQLQSANQYITFVLYDGSVHYVFYGRSKTLVFLTWFPVVQVIALALLLWLWIVTFRSSKLSEQNRVWVGLAKETAHQLGTPTSSLLGWVEYLKTQPVDQETVVEMEKDLTHLMKIADRFSKIGSDTPLEPTSINELVGEAVMYFRKRISRNVELDYNGLAMAPVRARINPALFEWVIENLLKNALDALQGHGTIDVRLSRDESHIYIDVADTGRGIARANREKIFEPGFTTKTRGWGLGLSLSRLVIQEYHKGRIFVAESEVGKGTTMRVAIKPIA
ncbi:MAG: HAMP domain-containing histidine kinase [Alistipes sp.]|jgi:signal transduction histidine kinase|nr:HAMP domain-containing histidine kinase [Alistipes sp.]